jgi:hypothetical protein
MSESFGIRTPEALIDAVRAKENEYEESLREKFLADKLFNVNHLLDVMIDPNLSAEYLDELEKDFLQEKKGLNMGERFALALSDKYLGKLHVVELGSTTSPGAQRSIDGLKHEYTDLRNWMENTSTDIKFHEFSRQESKRKVSVRQPVCPEAKDKIAIMVRNRPLLVGRRERNHQPLDFAVLKRMVFSLPLETLHALNAGTETKDLRFNDERSLQIIETCLEHGSGGVEPIRTSYYLATDVR